jgi:hypothetical protein
MTPALYTPPDVAEAAEKYGATCGPAALAAILQMPLMRLRRAFPGFPKKPWVNATTMLQALDHAKVRGVEKRKKEWPTYGLAFLQLDGPWTQPGVPVAVAYKHTHWVAVIQDDERRLYDINADGWLTQATWEATILPAIVAAMPEASGTYFVRWSCQVLQGREPPT